MERTRLIRITKNQIFLTEEMWLNLSETSLKGTDIKFRSVQDVYWKIEIINYNKIDTSLDVAVVDYEPKNIEDFKKQVAKLSVSYIRFKPLAWSYIEPHLSVYAKSKLERERIIFNDVSPFDNIRLKESSSSFKRRETNIFTPTITQSLNQDRQPKPKEPIIDVINENAKIYFKDADFNLGFVSFSYKSKQLNQTFNLKIENHFILAEFNAIKAYFPKAFGGKKQFTIDISFTLRDYVITDIVTTSSEIQSIDETIIDSIKRERIANLTSTPLRKIVDKSLFTAEDIFDSFDDNLKDGNIFKQSEEDILNFLIEIRNVRNAKQLQFLSGSVHSTKQKLRFTLKPLFGFLFFIEGETKNHFCWELLESHATYLWSFDKKEADADFQFKRVEDVINIIRDIGREAYKSDFKKKEYNGLSFHTIEHNNINSAFKEGFTDWQNKLKERLV